MPSRARGAIPAEPTNTGIPVPIACQPTAPRCQTSILAVEPPVPTTDSTCAEEPTLAANHGGWAPATGAEATPTTTALTAAQMDSGMRRITPSSNHRSAGVK
jgi:hypothetical protein